MTLSRHIARDSNLQSGEHTSAHQSVHDKFSFGRAELLSIYLAKLEDAPIDRCEETYRTISTVHLLLQSFHGDMDPAFREDMVVFLCEMFPKLHELRWANPSCRMTPMGLLASKKLTRDHYAVSDTPIQVELSGPSSFRDNGMNATF